MGKKWTNEAERHEFFLSKKVDAAVREHNMISQGDRILVGVSGGKDSMALLRLLACRQRFSPVKYELFAAYIKGDARGSSVDIPESFVQWVKELGVDLYIEDIHLTENEKLPMNCERCGRNRRRTLFEIAEKLRCNKLALGHTLDDLSHTALMNLFSNGKLETMAFKRVYFGGKFTLIRPLAYIKESDIIRFGEACRFPIVKSDCPMSLASDRLAARNLMLQVSRDFPSANINILNAVVNKQISGQKELD